MNLILSLVMLLALIGNMIVVIAFGLDMITLMQAIVSLVAFCVIGYTAAHGVNE